MFVAEVFDRRDPHSFENQLNFREVSIVVVDGNYDNNNNNNNNTNNNDNNVGNTVQKLPNTVCLWGHAVALLVEALRYKP